jgi:hypothetical protein
VYWAEFTEVPTTLTAAKVNLTLLPATCEYGEFKSTLLANVQVLVSIVADEVPRQPDVS